MSDPVSNVEIEDVLSSIRRLVSEDPAVARPGHGASGHAARESSEVSPEDPPSDSRDENSPETASGNVDGRLVLTPSLRVTPPREGAGDDAADAPGDPGVLKLRPEHAADAPDTGDGDADVPDGVERDAAHDARAATLESKIAELEAMIGRSEGDWEPDGAEPDEFPEHRTDPLPWDETEPTQAPAVAGESAQDAIAAAIGPDRADAAAQPAADEGGPESWNALEAGEGGFLDEDALRDMVAEIVRQELQGTLGERITRNVRKLVRREIHRALASQELD